MEWSAEQQGVVLGSFYYGYALSHVPGGVAAEWRSGGCGKWVFGLCTAAGAVATLAVPLVAGARQGEMTTFGPTWRIRSVKRGPCSCLRMVNQGHLKMRHILNFYVIEHILNFHVIDMLCQFVMIVDTSSSQLTNYFIIINHEL